MNIKKFYDTIGGDYNAARSRMLSDDKIEKYLIRFLYNENLETLKKAVKEMDYSTVFSITHNMKGVCFNLELTNLAKSVDLLCEDVRDGKPSININSLLDNVCENYEKIVAVIGELNAM